ncbi:MAG: hypothetical protein V3S89_09850 [Desulfobacterales bacterium]
MSVAGTFKLTMNTPMGTQTPTLIINEESGAVSGSMAGPMGTTEFSGGTVDGSSASWDMTLEAMGQQIKLSCNCEVDGDSISGKMSSPMGGADFTGQREG